MKRLILLLLIALPLTAQELRLEVSLEGRELRAIVGRADAITYSGERIAPAQLDEGQRRVVALLQALDVTRGRAR